MTSREEIIALAKECGIKNRCFPQSEIWGYEHNLEAFFRAAQRQAYERAAEECENQKVGIASYFEIDERIQWCVDAIRTLIEGETNV